ncbi:M20/M25/M40 family metallo-hydrolase [Sphingobium subterraneum]|uniref:Carboxypeptidase Q n=1 Tax=Sphingobium subterraneum TaxID=627688 RepID=A0A841IXR7_9SPHN|nr:M20/M25/M40 family metallo-hydrolase [Sphingobium subterraneum]MBB6123417.1 hypothetical protein [Sphingobium subterraneum]
MKQAIRAAAPLTLFLASMAWPGAAIAGPDTALSIDHLREKALTDSTAWKLVEQLTTLFGARPAGSPSEQAAALWGAATLRDMGFAHAAAEPFALETWEPGTYFATIVAPNPQQLVVTPLGGTTGASVEAFAAVFPTYAAFKAATPEALAGKIAVVLEAIPRTQDGSGYSRAIAIRMNGAREAAERGAVGYLMRGLGTQKERTANGGAARPEKTPFPAFALAPPDAEQLGRLARLGPVRLRLSSSAGWTGKSRSHNVVAEIDGRDPAAKAILVSAHLDSWEQGTGAVDDGFGIAVVTAAAKLVRDLPVRPRRTIRIVWFGAEEVSQPEPVNTFAGARAYAARHATATPPLALVAESDGGAGRVLRLAIGAPENGDLVVRLRSALSPLGVSVLAEAPRAGGPDISVLQATGIPAFRLFQDASSQFDTHHNANDVLSAIDPAALSQNVAAWAVSLWLIADSEDPDPAAPR